MSVETHFSAVFVLVRSIRVDFEGSLGLGRVGLPSGLGLDHYTSLLYCLKPAFPNHNLGHPG
jgi:hypothetical protein